jgi:hypothetical protein
MLGNQSVANEGPWTRWQPSTRAVMRGRYIIVLLLFQFQVEGKGESEKTEKSKGSYLGHNSVIYIRGILKLSAHMKSNEKISKSIERCVLN